MTADEVAKVRTLRELVRKMDDLIGDGGIRPVAVEIEAIIDENDQPLPRRAVILVFDLLDGGASFDEAISALGPADATTVEEV